MGRITLLFALLALLVGASAARAAEPPIQWVENAATTITLEDLVEKGLPVTVHNATSGDLEADIRVAAPEELADRFASIPLEVPANAEAPTTTLKARPGTDPEAGSYATTLVVSPVSGGALDRRTLTVTVAAPTPAPVSGAVLDPATLPDVTLPATNFLASPLAEIGSLLVVGAGGLIALLLIFRLRKPGWTEIATLVIGVCLVLGGFAGAFHADPQDPAGVELIAAESLPVSANATPGYVGSVLDGHGDVAWLEVDKGALHARALDHAGEHKGKVDLNGAAEGGSASATVNVRDWWLWAVLAIALGVGVGHRVRRWFERDRERSQLKLRLDTLRARVNSEHVADPDLERWVPKRRADARATAINTQLDTDETATAAEAAIGALEDYLDKAARLRARVATLVAARDELAAMTPGKDVVALTKANAVLEPGIDADTDDDPTGKQLDTTQTEVDGALELVTLISQLYPVLLRRLADIQNAFEETDDADTARKELLQNAHTTVSALANDMLAATKQDKAIEHYDAAITAVPDDVASDPSPPGDVRPVWTPPGTTPPAARIEARVLSGGQETSGAGNVDDVFLFRAVFAGAAPAPFDVRWDFSGGGKPVEQQVPAHGAGPWVEHRYPEPATYTVRLLSATGEELASFEQTVTGPSRLAAGKQVLERREDRFTRTAIALTIASGVSTLYMVDPAWGTNEDYVKALLWGAVVGEGVALVAAIIANRFPAKS